MSLSVPSKPRPAAPGPLRPRPTDRFPDLVRLDETALPPVTAGVLALATKLAAADPDFHRKKGPSEGDHHTTGYMAKLGTAIAGKWGGQVEAEQPVPSDLVKWRIDFYVPAESTAIEIALSSANPNTEMEKDIFKALVAREQGLEIDRLVLIGKAGTLKRLNNPAALVTRDFVRRHHGLAVLVREFPNAGDRP